MLQSQLDRADHLIRKKLLSQQQSTKRIQSKTIKKASKNMENFAVIGYMTCSSLMLITNKLAVYNVPAPSFVLWGQMTFAAVLCFILGSLGCLSVESLKFSKIKPFSIVSIVFLLTIFTNIKILQFCNVETFIVFRASTPLLISIGDFFCLGRELPSMQSWICLCGLLVSAYIYMSTDEGYHVEGYTWVLAWYFVFCVDQLLIKHVVTKVKFESNWSRVYYTNLLTAIPLTFGFIYNQELATVKFTIFGWIALITSCVLGVLMSYFAFLARHLTSATKFTVLGNACKVITVFINFLIWDKHANIYGLAALGVCLLCAYFYKQAPLRNSNESQNNRKNQSKKNLLPTNSNMV